VTVVDDYGHHPTEIRATLAAARECSPAARIHVVFQPHRFSRTLDLLDEFAAHLPMPTPCCAAHLRGQRRAHSRRDGRAARGAHSRAAAQFAPDFPRPSRGCAQAREGDLILTLGAGSVSQLAPQILAALESV
jgi:UDP-N-acetylmuramate--alanine ligase